MKQLNLKISKCEECPYFYYGAPRSVFCNFDKSLMDVNSIELFKSCQLPESTVVEEKPCDDCANNSYTTTHCESCISYKLNRDNFKRKE